MKNKFDWPKHREFKVLDENKKVVGTVRIKPNSILWAPKSAKGPKPWFAVGLDEFATYAQQLNQKQAS